MCAVSMCLSVFVGWSFSMFDMSNQVWWSCGKSDQRMPFSKNPQHSKTLTTEPILLCGMPARMVYFDVRLLCPLLTLVIGFIFKMSGFWTKECEECLMELWEEKLQLYSGIFQPQWQDKHGEVHCEETGDF